MTTIGILIQDNHTHGADQFAHGISYRALLARWRGIIHPLINQPNKETKPRITCPKKNAITIS